MELSPDNIKKIQFWAELPIEICIGALSQLLSERSQPPESESQDA